MTRTTKKLGKGLNALLESNPRLKELKGEEHIKYVAVELIQPNPSQPRFKVEPESLIGLADSIREHGILEPLIVTELKEPGRQADYQIVAGERRWRAAMLAQQKEVPVIVKDLSPRNILEIAIIENIQRQDLNPLEEATAIFELHNSYNLKLDEISKKVGKDISTLSNKMRLLKLPKQIQEGLMQSKITESHAYQLLSLKSLDAMLAAYNIIIKKELSVGQSEELIRKILHANRDVIHKTKKVNSVIFDEKTLEITKELGEKFGKGFKLVRKRNGGVITIPFADDEQLDKLYSLVRYLE